MEPPDSHDIIITTATGSEGLTPKQLRGPAFTATSRGVRVRSASLTMSGVAARAALAGCREEAVLTDLSAARMWDLPLPMRLAESSARTSIAVVAGAPHPRRSDVKGRRLRLPSFHVTEWQGVLLTTPARTWLDCAAIVPLADLVAMGDVILRRSLASEGELAHTVQWAFRRRGVVRARLAFPLLDPLAESPGESRMRVLMVCGGLPEPKSQWEVIERGRWLARVDFAWPEQRVIVEYDGRVHLEERQRRRDAERLNALQAAGWRVIVLTADDFRRPEQTCSVIRAALARS